jgi:hypothetical protein
MTRRAILLWRIRRRALVLGSWLSDRLLTTDTFIFESLINTDNTSPQREQENALACAAGFYCDRLMVSQRLTTIGTVEYFKKLLCLRATRDEFRYE